MHWQALQVLLTTCMNEGKEYFSQKIFTILSHQLMVSYLIHQRIALMLCECLGLVKTSSTSSPRQWERGFGL
jgi:hypothetical protein